MGGSAGGSKPMSMSASVPGGCQGTWGERGAHLTLEVGVQLYGLARPGILTDHLLEANLGDLNQVPRGEAALTPRDLVDGACRHRLSFKVQQGPSTGPSLMATGSAILRQHKCYLCLLALDVLLCGTFSGLLHVPVPPTLSS